MGLQQFYLSDLHSLISRVPSSPLRADTQILQISYKKQIYLDYEFFIVNLPIQVSNQIIPASKSPIQLLLICLAPIASIVQIRLRHVLQLFLYYFYLVSNQIKQYKAYPRR
jgi:hypothetical protein